MRREVAHDLGDWNVEGTLRQETQALLFFNQTDTYRYEYTPADLRSRITMPGGRIVDFKYSSGGVLDSVTTGTRIFTFRMDRAGRDSVISYPGGLVARYLYDDDGNLASLTATLGSRQGAYNYTYDLRRRPTALHGFDWNTTALEGAWEYDFRSQITYNLMEQFGRTVTASYGYDAAGNRVHETTTDEEYEYIYGGMTGSRIGLSNRLDIRRGLTFDDWTTVYRYQANGNLAADTSTHAQLTRRHLRYFYTGHNQLATNDFINWTAQYRYDGLGRMVHRRGATTTAQIRTTFDGVNVGRVQGMDVIQRPGSVDQPLVLMNDELDPCYYVTYGPRLFFAVHEAGDGCDQRATWQSYGRYTGPILMSQTLALTRSESEANGLSPFRSRFFDPETGRFTQEDPVGYAAGENLYSYGGNNPTSYTDPFGLQVCLAGPVALRVCAAAALTAGSALGSAGAQLFANVRSGEPILSGVGYAAAEGALQGATLALGAEAVASVIGRIGGTRAAMAGRLWPSPSANETRVARWMSESEFRAMRATGSLQGRATGISVSTPGAERAGAASTEVLVEFNVPTKALRQGGRQDWFLIEGENIPVTGIVRQ